MSAAAFDPVERFRAARRDPDLAVLEGFHPLKHALRFDAEVLSAVTPDPDALAGLAADLAPDLGDRIRDLVRVVPVDLYEELAPVPPATGVLAVARRPRASPSDLLAPGGDAPVVFLEEPVHLGNLGASIRVAAAAGAAGVLSCGRHDPWAPEALRGGAGLQFALPVSRFDDPGPLLQESPRALIAVDPGGEPLAPGAVPAASVLAFGTERDGLSERILRGADRRLAIPMQEGVSSLNLATSVAVVLYAWRLSPPDSGSRRGGRRRHRGDRDTGR